MGDGGKLPSEESRGRAERRVFRRLRPHGILPGWMVVGKDVDDPKNIGFIIELPGFLPKYSGINNVKYSAFINSGLSLFCSSSALRNRKYKKSLAYFEKRIDNKATTNRDLERFSDCTERHVIPHGSDKSPLVRNLYIKIKIVGGKQSGQERTI